MLIKRRHEQAKSPRAVALSWQRRKLGDGCPDPLYMTLPYITVIKLDLPKYKTAKPLLYTVYGTGNRKQLGRKWSGKEVSFDFEAVPNNSQRWSRDVGRQTGPEAVPAGPRSGHRARMIADSGQPCTSNYLAARMTTDREFVTSAKKISRILTNFPKLKKFVKIRTKIR